MNDYTGRRVRLARNVVNLWDGTDILREDTEGAIVQINDDSTLFHVKLDGGPEVWLGPQDFTVLADESPRYVLEQSSGVLSLFQQITPTQMVHFGPNISIDYGVDPPEVHLRGAEPDVAAKAFWNAVHAVVGRQPLFLQAANAAALAVGLQLRQTPPGGIVEEDAPGHYVMWLGNQAQIIAHRCYNGEQNAYATMLAGMRLVRINPDFGRYSVELFYEAAP